MNDDLRRARKVRFSKFLPPGCAGVLVDMPVMTDLAKIGVLNSDGSFTLIRETEPTAILPDGFGIDFKGHP